MTKTMIKKSLRAYISVDIELNLVDNAWKIVPSEEAVDAMLGGISSFTDALENAVTFDEG